MLKIHMKRSSNCHLIDKKVQSENNFRNSRPFVEYSNDMDHIYQKIKKYNAGKERKLLIVVDDMIANMLGKKRLI